MNIDTSIAEKFENDKDWENALIEYKKLQSLYPQSNLIIEKVGWCQSRLGLYDDAIKTYTELTIKEPKKAKWDYTVGYQYYSKKEWALAIDWFRKALSKYPGYFIVKYRMGYALTQCCGPLMKLQKKEFLEAYNQFVECENLYNQMTDEEKNREKAHYADVCFQKGKILLERSDWDGAIEVFNKAAMINKDNPDLKYNLGKALSNKRQYNEAYDLINDLKGKYYYDELKAETLSGLGRYDDSISIYLRLLDKRKRDYIYRYLSNTYLLKDDYKNAYLYAQKSIEIGRKNHKNYYHMACVYYKAGLLLSAKSELQKAIEIKKQTYDSDFIKAHNTLDEIENIILKNNIISDNMQILFELQKVDIPLSQTLPGIIKTYFLNRGFGFIENNGVDYYFHISSLPANQQKNVMNGIQVLFKPFSNEKGKAAIDIKIIT